MSESIILYDYWRSSASYRVRIALGLLGLPYQTQTVNLLTKEHHDEAFLAINPQGLLPALEIGGKRLTQSLAIIEYLHSTTPGSTLLPADPDGQFPVRQLSYAIAMEIHPICNLAVATHVAELTGGGEAVKLGWMRRFIGSGLEAVEALLALGETSRFCCGDQPTMADCCLIPQLYNADRWGLDYSGHPNILRIADEARTIAAFQAAHPDVVGPPED